ncbi:MAG: glycoside hydrolase family 99-like domain-containing protein [Pirellulaceae bacterium]
MNILRTVLLSFIVVTFSGIAVAQSDFQGLIQSGDRLRDAQQFDQALDQYEAAFAHAMTDTDRGIAFAKQAEVYSDDLADYVAAGELAGKAIELQDAAPAARVTALKVLARCQMQTNADYPAAIRNLKEALSLRDVDWAKPVLLLMLGDCYRFSDDYAQAIAAYSRVAKSSQANTEVKAIAYLNAGIVNRYGLKNVERAKLFFQKAVQLHPELEPEAMRHQEVMTAEPLKPKGKDKDTESTSPLILAHYMPWFSAKSEQGHWGWHWTMDHFDPESIKDGKREIASKFYPLIGPYDSGDIDVLEFHLLTMKLAGIDGVIVDWYGRSDFRDYAVLHRNTTRLLQQCERLGMKFVICYEDQTIPALVEGGRIESMTQVSHAAEEINWLHKYWFKSPSYVRRDNQPVMLSFGHAGLSDTEWAQCLDAIDAPIMYYSQDYRRASAVGGFDWPSPAEGLTQNDRFLIASKRWRDFIPVAFPRFVDIYQEAAVHEGFPVIDDNDGETFRVTLEKSLASKCKMIQIATWNDWGEGTQIEPSQEYGYRDLEAILEYRCKFMEPTFSNQPVDLRLPHLLLSLRRTEAGKNKQTLDEISNAIAAGQLAKAKQLLDSWNR